MKNQIHLLPTIVFLLVSSFLLSSCQNEEPLAATTYVEETTAAPQPEYNLQITQDTLIYGQMGNRYMTPLHLIFNDYFDSGTHILLKNTWAFGDEARNGTENKIWELTIPEKLNLTKGINYLDSGQYANGLAIKTRSGHILTILLVGGWNEGNEYLKDSTKPVVKIKDDKVLVSYELSTSDVEGDVRAHSTYTKKVELPIVKI